MLKFNSSIIKKTRIWHNWFGHLNYSNLRQLYMNQKTKDLLLIGSIPKEVCEVYNVSY